MWIKLQIGQKYKLDKIASWTTLQIGQNWTKLDIIKNMDKIGQYMQVKNGQNQKLNIIENMDKIKSEKIKIGQNEKLNKIENMDKNRNWTK